MGKFDLQAIRDKIAFRHKIKQEVFGSIAGVTLSMLLPKLDKIIKGLRETISSGVMSNSVFKDLDSLYNDQCVKNKTIKDGGYVGDKYLFDKMLQHYPNFRTHVNLLGEPDKDFIDKVIIPFIESLKTQLSEQMFKKVYRE